jgi:MOB kinase activator 1
MSGFITTMFVSSSSFPTKPKPLVPVSAFVLSQSCMDLSMDLDVRDIQSDVWSNIDHISTSEHPNYSYKLISSAARSTADLNLRHDAAPDSRRNKRGSVDTGSIIGPAARARAEAPRNKGYFSAPSLLSSFFSNPRTRAPFKPQKSNRGTSSWQLKQYAEATLGSGSLRKAVKLPEGEDKDEWLAVNVVDFYNQINLLYGSITEFCSPQSCPEMKATDE